MASAEKFADSTHANRPYLGHFLISNLIVMPTLCCGYNLDFPSILMDANSSSYKKKKIFSTLSFCSSVSAHCLFGSRLFVGSFVSLFIGVLHLAVMYIQHAQRLEPHT